MFAEVSSLPAEVGGESGCSGLQPEFSPDPAPETWSDAEILPWGAVHADQLMARKLLWVQILVTFYKAPFPFLKVSKRTYTLKGIQNQTAEVPNAATGAFQKKSTFVSP